MNRQSSKRSEAWSSSKPIDMTRKTKPSEHYYNSYGKTENLILAKHTEIESKTKLDKRVIKRYGFFEDSKEPNLTSTLRIETPTIKNVTYSTNKSTKTFLSDLPRQSQLKCPNWISLRENYLRQLENCIASVIACGKNSPETIEQERGQFVALLFALRTVTVNLVHSYNDLLKESEVVVPHSDHAHNLSSLKRYLYHVCHSMDWLQTNGNPSTTWMGHLDTTMNPLLCTHNLAGVPLFRESFLSAGQELALTAEDVVDGTLNQSWAYSVEQVKRLPPQLQFTSKVFKELQSTSEVLYRVHSEWHQVLVEQQLKLKRAKTEAVLKEQSRNSTLSFLLFDHDDKDRLERDFYSSAVCHRFNVLSDAFHRWIRSYNNELKIKAKVHERAHKTKQTVFNALVWFKWQCYRYRDMQIAVNNRVLFRCFDAWREYLIWCLQFNRLYARGIANRKSYFLFKLKHYTLHNFHNRSFVHNVAHRRKQTTFRCLRRNVILNKFAIRLKLRNKSTHKSAQSFYLKFLMAHCYWKWRTRIERLRALHCFKVFMDRYTLKVHFWKLLPGPVRIEMPLSVSMKVNTSFRYIK